MLDPRVASGAWSHPNTLTSPLFAPLLTPPPPLHPFVGLITHSLLTPSPLAPHSLLTRSAFHQYGYFLHNHSVALKSGKGNITGWQAHRACMGKGKLSDCINSTFTPELYEDDFTAVNAIELLKRRPANKPWFLHVSFPGPHDPFLVTADMRNAASDGRVWPEGMDNPKNNTPGGACATVVDPSGTRNRCNCESGMNETGGHGGRWAVGGGRWAGLG